MLEQGILATMLGALNAGVSPLKILRQISPFSLGRYIMDDLLYLVNVPNRI